MKKKEVRGNGFFEKAKIFEIIESRKLLGKAKVSFGLKKFSSYVNNPAKFLSQTKLWETFYVSFNVSFYV